MAHVNKNFTVSIRCHGISNGDVVDCKTAMRIHKYDIENVQNAGCL